MFISITSGKSNIKMFIFGYILRSAKQNTPLPPTDRKIQKMSILDVVLDNETGLVFPYTAVHVHARIVGVLSDIIILIILILNVRMYAQMVVK